MFLLLKIICSIKYVLLAFFIRSCNSKLLLNGRQLNPELRTICKIAGKLGKLTLQPLGLIVFNWKRPQKGSDEVIKMGRSQKTDIPEH
jgi:hypothetical protein